MSCANELPRRPKAATHDDDLVRRLARGHLAHVGTAHGASRSGELTSRTRGADQARRRVSEEAVQAPTDPEDEATATRATRAGATAEVADLRAGRTADARDFRILSASWMSKIGLHANFSAARNRSRK